MNRGHAALLALVVSSCSPAAQNARGRTALESRASFDLECPRSALALAPLGKDAHGVITSYGVEGCGRRATYVRLSDATWLMNPPHGAPAAGPRSPVRAPVQRRTPVLVPVPSQPRPPRPVPSAAPAPSGSAEHDEEPRPPSSLHPGRGEPEPRLPELPGQGERPKPL